MSRPLPLEYLESCSRAGLQSFMLSRMEHVANLKRERRQLEDQILAAEAEALYARHLLDTWERRIELGRIDALQMRLLPDSPVTQGLEERRILDISPGK